MERLTGLDATFLYLESGGNLMHVASTAVFDPSTVEGGYSFEKVKEMVAARLHLLPPFRRRLVEVPFELHHPLWIEDPDFDLDFHLRRAALPAPGGEQELAEFAAEIIGRPLDRSRPLWEMYMVEGLEHGYIASISKVHHAAIDGVSGAELMVNLLDFSPEVAEVPPPEEPWRPDRIPTDMELVGWALNSLSRQPIRAVKTMRRTATAAVSLRRRNRQPDVTPPPAPFSAPNTSLNTAITPHRRFAFAQVQLDDVKKVKNKLGGTVNDVVLALCAGALKSYLEDRGEHVTDPLVAMVPISVRTEDQQGAMGNRVSSMLTSLATHIDDPVERLAAISAGTKHAKEQDKAIGAETLMDWAEFAAPGLAARAARLYSRMKLADRHRPIFNVTISNVPGPDFPLYSAGARMVAYYPMGPIADGGALNITVMSYMGTMCFGLVACRETVPEVWSIAEGLRSSLDELVKAADAV
ncbi:MAG TPA: wax ester/triacylglycerol synthase family O-acyltransferase [Acidimicrobiales bacterium]|jgi:diacylglycerol O-acyltransferase / wax synthase|nr:wax ester/triacylglycerol synthase family O-acyltransferase [Acidimicrobiales bacterium]